MRTLVILLVMLGALPVQASTERETLGDLLAQCKALTGLLDGRAAQQTATNYVDAAQCTSYLEGLRDAGGWFNDERLGAEKFLSYCVPQKTTLEQIVRSLIEDVDDMPELLDDDKFVTIGRLGVIYPCG